MSVFNVLRRKPSLGARACFPSNACQSRLLWSWSVESLQFFLLGRTLNCEVESTALDKNRLLCNSQYGVINKTEGWLLQRPRFDILATLPLVTMTSEMKQCIGRWKLTEKRISIWDYLEKSGASGKRSTKSAQGELLFCSSYWRIAQKSGCQWERALGTGLTTRPIKYWKWRVFGILVRGFILHFWGDGEFAAPFIVQDRSPSRLQSFDQ